MYKRGEKCKNIFCLGGMKMDEQEIQQLVEEVSMQYFGMPFYIRRCLMVGCVQLVGVIY